MASDSKSRIADYKLFWELFFCDHLVDEDVGLKLTPGLNLRFYCHLRLLSAKFLLKPSDYNEADCDLKLWAGQYRHDRMYLRFSLRQKELILRFLAILHVMKRTQIGIIIGSPNYKGAEEAFSELVFAVKRQICNTYADVPGIIFTSANGPFPLADLVFVDCCRNDYGDREKKAKRLDLSITNAEIAILSYHKPQRTKFPAQFLQELCSAKPSHTAVYRMSQNKLYESRVFGIVNDYLKAFVDTYQ
jgi:hypothetical protein